MELPQQILITHLVVGTARRMLASDDVASEAVIHITHFLLAEHQASLRDLPCDRQAHCLPAAPATRQLWYSVQKPCL